MNPSTLIYIRLIATLQLQLPLLSCPSHSTACVLTAVITAIMDNNHTRDQKNTSHKRDIKQPAARVSEVVNFDEKREVAQIQDDLQHSVARPLNELEQHVNDLDDSWETESLLAEMLDGLTDDQEQDGEQRANPQISSSSRLYPSPPPPLSSPCPNLTSRLAAWS